MIASLWVVTDDSTSNLMQSFYRYHAAATVPTKAEAFTPGAIGFALIRFIAPFCHHWQLAIERFRPNSTGRRRWELRRLGDLLRRKHVFRLEI